MGMQSGHRIIRLAGKSPGAHFASNRLSAALGAEVVGMDLRSPDVAAIREMLMEHQALVFRGQDLTPTEHVSLARNFGRVKRADDRGGSSFVRMGEYPEILRLSGNSGAADEWHSDWTCSKIPLWLCILRAVEIPAVGGDTMWSNQYMAYEKLSQSMREVLSGLSAIHEAGEESEESFSAIHLVARLIPETGKTCLYVNRGYTTAIEGFHESESDALLEYLYMLSDDPALQFRYKWEPGDVVMWDNRCTQHYAVNDYSEYRWVERVSVYEND